MNNKQQEQELVEIIQSCCNGCSKEKVAFNKLILLKESYLKKYTYSLIKRKNYLIKKTGFSYDEIYASVLYGFMRAVRKHNPEKSSLNSYASLWMEATVLRDFKEMTNSIYVPEEKQTAYFTKRETLDDEVTKALDYVFSDHIEIDETIASYELNEDEDRALLFKATESIVDEIEVYKKQKISPFFLKHIVLQKLKEKGYSEEEVIDIIKEQF